MPQQPTDTEPAGPAAPFLLAELTAMLQQVTGEDGQWAAAVTSASRIEGDLRLESIELTALAGLLADKYGEQVDLVAYLADLDIDQLIDLTVGDVVAYVASSRPAVAVSQAGT
ncbi:MAG TPA: hypothetical protein VGS19_12655 [Streptosporangiaceae bacterium]|nr:hypothetical protein [Streptosporangiaceae bacterium]